MKRIQRVCAVALAMLTGVFVFAHASVAEEKKANKKREVVVKEEFSLVSLGIMQIHYDSPVFAIEKKDTCRVFRFRTFVIVDPVAIIGLDEQGPGEDDAIGDLFDRAMPYRDYINNPSWELTKHLMVQVDLCPTKFKTAEEARLAYDAEKLEWIKGVMRRSSSFAGEITIFSEPLPDDLNPVEE